MGALESCCDESGQVFDYEALSKEEFIDPKSINKAWQDCVISRNLLSLPGQIVEDELALESPVTLDGLNALLYYTNENYFNGVKFLIGKLKCDMNYTHIKTGDTALHLAARLGNTKIMIYLLGNGADSSIMNIFDETAEDVCLLKRDRKHFDSVAIEQRKRELHQSQTQLDGCSVRRLITVVMSDEMSSEPESIINEASLSPAPLDLGMAVQSYRFIEEEQRIKRSIEDRTYRDIRDPQNSHYFRFKSVQTELARRMGIELDVLATLFRRATFEIKFEWWLRATDHNTDLFEEAVNAELNGQSEETVKQLAAEAAKISKSEGRRKKKKTHHTDLLGSPSSYATRGPGQTDPKLLAHSKYFPSITGAHELIKLLIAVVSRLKTQFVKSTAFTINMDDIKILMPLVKSKFTPDKEKSIARITILEEYLSEQNPILMGYGFGDYTDESGAESEMDVAVMLEWSEKEIRQRRHKRRKKKARKKQELREEMMATHDGDGGDPMQFMDDDKSSMEIDEHKRRMMPDGSTQRVTVYEVLNGERIVELEDGHLSRKFELSFDDFIHKFSEALFYIHDELHIEWVKFIKAERRRARKEQELLDRKEEERRAEFRRARSMTVGTVRSVDSSDENEYLDAKTGHSRGSSIREVLSMAPLTRSKTAPDSGAVSDDDAKKERKKKKKKWYKRMKK